MSGPSRRAHEAPPPHTILGMSAGERPRERLEQLGPGALSDIELLAIILRTGYRGSNAIQLSASLLADCGRLGGLARTSFAELATQKGMGKAKAAQLAAALELGRRAANASLSDLPQVRQPADAAALLSDMATLEREEMRVLLLNQKNRVTAIRRVYEGSLHTTVVRVAELFTHAVRENAASIIVAHNHPSGDPAPSPEDAALTREIVQAGRLLDVEVLDHLVVGAAGKFVSLKERGLGFEK
ncbi:MAG: RadC family protein [Rudaea sp.]